MPKGPMKRDPLTGVSLGRIGRDLPEEDLTLEGMFDRIKLPDCDLFCVRSIAAATGYSPQYLMKTVVTDPSSPLHLHKIRGENGLTIFATSTQSAQVGGVVFRNKKAAVSRLNLIKNFTDIGG